MRRQHPSYMNGVSSRPSLARLTRSQARSGRSGAKPLDPLTVSASGTAATSSEEPANLTVVPVRPSPQEHHRSERYQEACRSRVTPLGPLVPPTKGVAEPPAPEPADREGIEQTEKAKVCPSGRNSLRKSRRRNVPDSRPRTSVFDNSLSQQYFLVDEIGRFSFFARYAERCGHDRQRHPDGRTNGLLMAASPRGDAAGAKQEKV